MDFLVEFTDQGDLFDPVVVKRLLQEAIGCPVDVVAAGGLKPDMRETVLREVRYAACTAVRWVVRIARAAAGGNALSMKSGWPVGQPLKGLQVS